MSDAPNSGPQPRAALAPGDPVLGRGCVGAQLPPAGPGAMTRVAQRGPSSTRRRPSAGVGSGAGPHVRGAGGRTSRAGGAYLLEVEEGGWARHGVREHAAGIGQQEAARVRHGAQHGAAGGRPAAEAALRSLRGSHPRRVPRCVRAPCLPGALSVSSSSSSSSGRPLPLVALLKIEAWKESLAPLPGAPLPGRGC